MATLRTVLFCILFVFMVLQCHGQLSPVPTRGTLVTALANRQGIVVMTDSRASIRDESGHFRPDPDHPIQKLLQYDEHIVCAIAGLWFDAVRKPNQPNKDILPRLDTQVLGLVLSYRDAVRRNTEPADDGRNAGCCPLGCHSRAIQHPGTGRLIRPRFGGKCCK